MYFAQMVVFDERKISILKEPFIILLLELNSFKCHFINLAIKSKR